MATSAASKIIYLGIQVNPGPLQRHRLENFSLENTVDALKQEASIRAEMNTNTLELIHHGRVLEDATATLAGSGVKEGEMVHVLKKDYPPPSNQPLTYTDAELYQIVTSLRAFGCTPNAPGWTRAMQVLDDDERLGELLEAVPSLAEDCSSLSILHEIELLAALGATLNTMRRGATALPSLPAALRHLGKMVKAHPAPAAPYNAPTSGFAYSLEALSEDDDGDEEDEDGASRPPVITQEQLATALGMAHDNLSVGGLLNMMRGSDDPADPALTPPIAPTAGGSRNIITPDMFSSAVSQALTRAAGRAPPAPSPAGPSPAGPSPMDQSTTASSSQSPTRSANPDDYSAQLRHMHEMGLLDDAVNLRALLVCNGDVNAAINFVFTSMEE